MKPVWLIPLIGLHLSLGWAYSDSISGSGNSNSNLNIGAIFSLETVNAKVSHIAMQAAVDDINSDSTILGGRKLSLSVHDANRSGFLSIKGALRFMEKDYVAIIGPQSSIMAHVLSPLANELHIPLLSFTALDPTLSPLQHPYFIQTAPNDLYQINAIADMISYFGWTEVVAIFTDGDETRNGISVLGRKLEEGRCRISYKAALPTDFKGNGRRVMMGELLKVKTMVNSRVIVVHTSTVSGPLILKLAKELGMVRPGYAWLATSWLSDVLDSSDQDSSGGYDIGSFQGVLTLRHHVPDSKKKSDFISRWDKLLSHGTTINSSNYSVGLNPNGLYAYDTVWLIARALRAFLDKGYNITFSTFHSDAVGAKGSINLSIFDGGEDLLTLIRRTNLTGVTGQMIFNTFDSDNRYSMSNNPSFDVLDVVGNRLRLVGYWSNYSGLSVDPPQNFHKGGYSNTVAASPKLMDGRMVWPGGGRKVPRGWVLSHGGKKLRIGVPYRASFRGFVSVDNRTDRNNVTGCSIDVFLTAVKLLPYPVPFEFVVFGDGRHNPNYDDLLSRIRTKEFDAVVGDIAIVTSRAKIVDFTLPFIESGLVVVAPAKKMDSSAWAFLKPFSPFMWIITAISFFCLGAVIWILEHEVNHEFRGTPRKQFVKALWFSFSTMFFAHRVYPVSTLGRIVLLIWLFVVLIIQSSYTASLAAILTAQELSSPIKGIDTLVTSNRRIGYQVGSFAANYLNEELQVQRSRLVALDSPEDYARALENGTVGAVVDESPYVDLFLSRYSEFTIVGRQFTKSGWGFAFPRDSRLAVDMTNALLELTEKGELQKIIEEWKRRMGGHCRTSRTTSSPANQKLHFSNFSGLFLILGTACFIVLVVHFCLIACEFMRHESAGPATSSRFARFRAFLSFIDKKE